MPTCVNFLDGWFRLYSSVTDTYVTVPLKEEDVLRLKDVSRERVERAKANGCSYIDDEDRCIPGQMLVRRSDGDLVPEDPTEWIPADVPLAGRTITPEWTPEVCGDCQEMRFNCSCQGFGPDAQGDST